MFFIAIQVIVTYCVMGVWYLVAGSITQHEGALLVTTSILFGIITIALFIWRRWAPVSGDYIKSRPWTVLFWTFMAALGIILPSIWLQEKMPELPNFLDWWVSGVGYYSTTFRGGGFPGCHSEVAARKILQAMDGDSHLGLAFCADSLESCPDAACLCGGTAVGMDVLAYGEYHSRRAVPCDKQYGFLYHDASLSSGGGHVAGRSFRQRSRGFESRGLLATYPIAIALPTLSPHEKGPLMKRP